MSNQMNYAADGHPLPSNGTPRSAAELFDVFTYIAAQHNATDTLVAGAVSTGVATTQPMAKFNATGGMDFIGTSSITGTFNVVGGVTIQSPNGTTRAETVRGATGDPNQPIWAVTSTNGTTVYVSVDKVSGVVGVTSAVAITAPAFHGPADSLAAPIPFKSAIAEFALSTNATALTVSIAPGKYKDSAGNSIVFAGGTATVGTPPGSPNQRWDAISFAPGAGVTVTPGNDATYGHSTDIGNPPTTRPNTPPSNALLGYVFVRNGATIIAAADIDDWRNPISGGGSGGGGGGGGIAISAAVVTDGDLTASYANSKDINAILNGSSAHGTVAGLIKDGAAGARFFDTINYYIQPDIPTRITRSGNTLTLHAGTGGSGIDGTPATIGIYNSAGTRVRTVTAAPAAVTASGLSGPRYLVADLSAAGVSTFALLLQTSPSVGAYQVLLRTYYFSATFGLVDTYASGSPLGTLPSNQVPLLDVVATNSGNDLAFTSNTNYTKPPNMARTPFTLVEPTKVVVLSRIQGFWSATTPGGTVEAYAMFDDLTTPISTAYINHSITTYASGATGAVAENWSEMNFDVVQLSAGDHTITQVVHTVSPAVSDLYTRQVRVLLFGAW